MKRPTLAAALIIATLCLVIVNNSHAEQNNQDDVAMEPQISGTWRGEIRNVHARIRPLEMELDQVGSRVRGRLRFEDPPVGQIDIAIKGHVYKNFVWLTGSGRVRGFAVKVWLNGAHWHTTFLGGSFVVGSNDEWLDGGQFYANQ